MRVLVVFFLLYGGIHAYIAHAANHAFAPPSQTRLLIWLAALLLTFSPLLLWQLERHPGARTVSVTLAWIAFCWMGYAFLFFWLGLAVNLYEFGARLAGLPVLAVRPVFLALALASLAVWLYGFHSARNPRVERVAIESGKLPHDFPGLRIVQISDVHLGMLIGRQRLDAILEQVRALQPDVLVSTGDLVDAQAHYLDGLSSRHAAYQPRLGKFAVTGNHEHHAGLEHALDFHRRAGFRLLRGETVELPGGVTLVGVDDPAVLAGHTDETSILARIPVDRFVLLLKHRPVVAPGGRFDLQLSGHTHMGQMFPFGLLVNWVYPMSEGLNVLSDGRQLYVSRGTGTWGPPIRVLAPAEITLIELKGSQR